MEQIQLNKAATQLLVDAAMNYYKIKEYLNMLCVAFAGEGYALDVDGTDFRLYRKTDGEEASETSDPALDSGRSEG